MPKRSRSKGKKKVSGSTRRRRARSQERSTTRSPELVPLAPVAGGDVYSDLIAAHVTAAPVPLVPAAAPIPPPIPGPPPTGFIRPANPSSPPHEVRPAPAEMPPPEPRAARPIHPWLPPFASEIGGGKRNFITHAKQDEITKQSKRWGVKVPIIDFPPGPIGVRQRALALVKGIRDLPVQRLVDRRQAVAARDARELQARTAEEARVAGRVEGRGRNVHGASAPSRSRGILGEEVVDRPPEESESSVHNPAAGTRTVIPPSPAAPVDVHGQPARPVPSSAPPPLPAPAYEEEPLSPANEARRRRDMAAASPLRRARDDVRFETTEMAALESGLFLYFFIYI